MSQYCFMIQKFLGIIVIFIAKRYLHFLIHINNSNSRNRKYLEEMFILYEWLLFLHTYDTSLAKCYWNFFLWFHINLNFGCINTKQKIKRHFSKTQKLVFISKNFSLDLNIDPNAEVIYKKFSFSEQKHICQKWY